MFNAHESSDILLDEVSTPDPDLDEELENGDGEESLDDDKATGGLEDDL